MRLTDRPDGAGLDEFDHAAVIVGGVDLRAHLRGDCAASLEILVLHQPGFANGVGQRLLAIDVFACPHRRDGGQRVMMVGGADHHAVDLRVADDLAPVGERPGVGKLFPRLVERPRIDVAEGDDILAFDAARVSPSASADADDRQVQLFVGGCVWLVLCEERRRRSERRCGSEARRSRQKLTSG